MEEETRKLLRQNLEYTKEVHKMVISIKKYLFWSRIFAIVKIVIIVLPLVIAILFAVPYLSGLLKSYQDVLGTLNSLNGSAGSSLFDSLLNK
jgi:hypothetical protein